jgi:cysteinyl-tRNA synthetase
VLGLENEITGNSSLTNQLIELVLELRKDAKANKNYQISDKIRDELVKIGVEIKDGKDTTSYTIKN